MRTSICTSLSFVSPGSLNNDRNQTTGDRGRVLYLYGIIPAYVIKAFACSLNPSTWDNIGLKTRSKMVSSSAKFELKLGFVVIFPPALLPSFPGIGCAEQSLQQPECPVGFVEHPHPKAWRPTTRWSTSPLDKGNGFNLVRVSSASSASV